MSREPSGAGAVPPASESGCSSPSEGTQEGSGRSVVLDLTSFHRSLAERRRVALQDGAASAGGELPNIAVLSNGDKQVKTTMGDLLASIGDEEAPSVRSAIRAAGRVAIDPDTVTVEGMRLLQCAFSMREVRIPEDKAVHLLHITILLGIKYLFRCIDEQPHSFVTDANCLAITTCLFDHERSGGRLVQHCLKRLHRLWPKLVARCTTDLRQLLASCAAMPFTPIVVDAFRISSDPSLGGFCNARLGYGILLHLLRGQHTAQQCQYYRHALALVNDLPDQPLKMIPYLFAKQIAPDAGNTCPHCHAHLLFTLLQSKCTPTANGITEIHSTEHSTVVVWRVPRFSQASAPQYSFDFRTSRNRVLHMRIDPKGFGRGKNSHLSLFLKESSGLDQEVHFHFVLAVTSSRQDAFVRPMAHNVLCKKKKEYTGRQAFMPLSVIQESGYLEPDGSLMIMLEVVELPDPPAAPDAGAVALAAE